MSYKITILLYSSFLFNILSLALVTLLIARRYGLVYKIKKKLLVKLKKAHNNYSAYYLHKTSQFEILPKTEDAVIFLGDSITDEAEWTELLDKPNIKNRGISGDTTDGILNRLDEIVKSQPQKIFIMIGINDLMSHKSVTRILADYKYILSDFQNQIPNTEVFIQSVLPVNNKITRYWQNNNNILKLNLGLQELGKEFKNQYINVFSHLSDSENQLDTQYTLDGLHLNGQGYLAWKKVIEKHVM
ncbi:GDSL-type esterase/lipase family protein [Calothrix sp. PCC 7507]|uniref:GDSL-type esterase/lipase family protein n=1 Tax=Calothrix sp. PCC 7507 TaxID=99598 RepID=UPI00029F1293|nr:GDSL-type esterase/lipase family protein [Calothrix sp. PCC 7507]AFY33166.1 lipolytic protein G-D-S-L family [Calothrix sp. PCC 7507]